MEDSIKTNLPEENQATSVKIRLKLPDEDRHGLYANYLLINFTRYEFRLHFAYLSHPEKEGDDAIADVVAKINVPIEMMPEIIGALQQNFEKFKQLQNALREKSGESHD